MPLKGVRDLDSQLPPKGKPKERIALIGIELEGGWTSVPPGVTITHDGSVRNLVGPPTSPSSSTPTPLEAAARQAAFEQQVEREFNRLSIGRSLGRAGQEQLRRDIRRVVEQQQAGQRQPLQTGEIPSPIMPPVELVPWMRRHYPQVVNDTCGLHVHMSFENALHYQRLMVPSYQDTILHYVTSWATREGLPAGHPIWPRLRGESRFCRHDFWPDLQVIQRDKSHDQNRHGHRYTALNFCHGTHGTVECRLLPMLETPDQGIRAVQLILDVTNAFLGKYKAKEAKGRCEVLGDEGFSLTKVSRLSREERGAAIQ